MTDHYGPFYCKLGHLRTSILQCINVNGPYSEKLRSHCWDWQCGRFSRNGYGRVKCEGGHERVAHRVVYEELVGPIPAGHILDHLCERRSCVNPAHMEPVTHRINTLRGKAVLFKTAAEYQIKEVHSLAGARYKPYEELRKTVEPPPTKEATPFGSATWSWSVLGGCGLFGLFLLFLRWISG